MTQPKEVVSRWLRRGEFAEVAEAIGIRTDQIVMAYTDPDADHELTVAYSIWDHEAGTPEPQDHTYYIARISRDEHGILVLIGEPHYSEHFTSFMEKVWEDVPAEIERRLEEKHGSGD